MSMKKGGMVADISEALLELGKSTTKQTAKAVAQTFNPIKITEKVFDPTVENQTPEITTQQEKNSTKLDLKDLNEKYKKQDDSDINIMRQRLFKIVKEGEEKAITERKREEEERTRQEERDKQEKLKKQQAQQQELPATPKGKERKSILGAHKKKADLSHAEIKPAGSNKG